LEDRVGKRHRPVANERFEELYMFIDTRLLGMNRSHEDGGSGGHHDVSLHVRIPLAIERVDVERAF
jgi:hypothetical protein